MAVLDARYWLASIGHPVSSIQHQVGNRRILTFLGSFGHFLAIMPAGASRKFSAVPKLDQTITSRRADTCRYDPGRLRAGIGGKMLRGN